LHVARCQDDRGARRVIPDRRRGWQGMGIGASEEAAALRATTWITARSA
jgi:hypothetical protein